MGMYDSFIVVDEQTASGFVCAAGHPQRRVEMQTKDLECQCRTYYVCFDRLYVVRQDDKGPDEEFRVNDAGLVIQKTQLAVRHGLNQAITVYRSCSKCDPVVFERDTNFMGRVDQRYPHVEFDVTFLDGVVSQVGTGRCETRDDVRRALIRDGVDVLDDDDRIAKKHLELLRREGYRE